jgi:hypothetical protein
VYSSFISLFHRRVNTLGINRVRDRVISKGIYIAARDNFPTSRERPGSDIYKG